MFVRSELCCLFSQVILLADVWVYSIYTGVHINAQIILLMNRRIKPISMSYCLMQEKGSLCCIGCVDKYKTLHLELPIEDL